MAQNRESGIFLSSPAEEPGEQSEYPTQQKTRHDREIEAAACALNSDIPWKAPESDAQFLSQDEQHSNGDQSNSGDD